MRPDRAIEELELLKDEAGVSTVTSGGEQSTAWQGRVRGVLVAALGPDDHLVERFDAVRYSLQFVSSSTPRHRFKEVRASGISNACGIIGAAVYQLRVESKMGTNRATPATTIRNFGSTSRTLWRTKDWFKVASQAAIFVESHIRTCAGEPKGEFSRCIKMAGMTCSLLDHVQGHPAHIGDGLFGPVQPVLAEQRRVQVAGTAEVRHPRGTMSGRAVRRPLILRDRASRRGHSPDQ